MPVKRIQIMKYALHDQYNAGRGHYLKVNFVSIGRGTSGETPLL